MSDALDAYRSKRDFGATPEPDGSDASSSDGALRFSVQEHHATRLHWDLRLERDGVLASFALPHGLPAWPGRNVVAVRTEDHPLEYLEFSGEIPAGSYGAGTMALLDVGTYEPLKFDDDKIELALAGERFRGRYALFPTRGDDWMIHRMDAGELAPMPEALAPMLATAADLPRADGWAFELKWDGIRAIVHAEPGRLTLRTRNLNDVTKRYPELRELSLAIGHRHAILDAEIVAFGDDGKPSFAALQTRMHVEDADKVRRAARRAPVSLVVFDLLWLDGRSLMGAPYRERRAALAQLGLDSARVSVPGSVDGHGEQVLGLAAEQGLEGVVAKRLDSGYEPGRRTKAWVKVKHITRDDFLIVGWVPGEGRRRDHIGALVLGERTDDGTLRGVGRVGTGFTEAELRRLRVRLEGSETDASPIDGGGPKQAKETVFVEPRLSCEVEYLMRSPAGVLRAPSYKGLREDKAASAARVVRANAESEVVEVDGREIRLANPDKVLYPATGFTKRDLLDYYVAIAPALLAHLADRRLTLKRYPHGVEGEHFFEKRAPPSRPDWVKTSARFVVADSAAALAWLANLADLELHTPMARAEDPDRPAILAFDLDPGDGAGLAECCEVARWLRAMLDGLGLQAFPKTSGSKGMQVYVPLNHPATTHEATKRFAKTVAELLAREAPELVVATQSKARRVGKVLVDWSQNDDYKTTVCVYSPRARERPTVSTPLRWEELDGDPDALVFETADVLARVAADGDLFAPVATLVQALPG